MRFHTTTRRCSSIQLARRVPTTTKLTPMPRLSRISATGSKPPSPPLDREGRDGSIFGQDAPIWEAGAVAKGTYKTSEERNDATIALAATCRAFDANGKPNYLCFCVIIDMNCWMR